MACLRGRWQQMGRGHKLHVINSKSKLGKVVGACLRQCSPSPIFNFALPLAAARAINYQHFIRVRV